MNSVFRYIDSLRYLFNRSVRLKHILLFIMLLFLIFITSCIAQFMPEISENQDLLVVEGLITSGNTTNEINNQVNYN